MANPSSAAASDIPSAAISTVHSGVNRTPPTLAPLNAMLIALGLSLSNHGDTRAFNAAPLVADQPSALSSNAGTRCHGSAAFAQAMAPTPANTAPAIVTRAMPKRR